MRGSQRQWSPRHDTDAWRKKGLAPGAGDGKNVGRDTQYIFCISRRKGIIERKRRINESLPAVVGFICMSVRSHHNVNIVIVDTETQTEQTRPQDTGKTLSILPPSQHSISCSFRRSRRPFQGWGSAEKTSSLGRIPPFLSLHPRKPKVSPLRMMLTSIAPRRIPSK